MRNKLNLIKLNLIRVHWLSMGGSGSGGGGGSGGSGGGGGGGSRGCSSGRRGCIASSCLRLLGLLLLGDCLVEGSGGRGQELFEGGVLDGVLGRHVGEGVLGDPLGSTSSYQDCEFELGHELSCNDKIRKWMEGEKRMRRREERLLPFFS